MAVERDTGGSQIPWVASSLRGEFYFLPATAAIPMPAESQAGAPAVVPTSQTAPPSSEGPEMTQVPGGRFVISRRPVSLDAYRRFAEAAGREAPSPDPGANPSDLARVTWQEAVDYAGWLARRTGQAYRLPTEAEWQLSCSGGGADDRSRGAGSGMDLLRISARLRRAGTALRESPAGGGSDSRRSLAGGSGIHLAMTWDSG